MGALKERTDGGRSPAGDGSEKGGTGKEREQVVNGRKGPIGEMEGTLY